MKRGRSRRCIQTTACRRSWEPSSPARMKTICGGGADCDIFTAHKVSTDANKLPYDFMESSSGLATTSHRKCNFRIVACEIVAQRPPPARRQFGSNGPSGFYMNRIDTMKKYNIKALLQP